MNTSSSTPVRAALKRRLVSIGLLLAASFLCLPTVQAQDIEKGVKVAPGLYELVVAPAAKRVYVASVGHRGEHNANVIALNAKTLEQTGKIAVNDAPVFGLAINHKTGLIYGTATTSNKVIVIDPAKRQVVATIGNDVEGHLREAAVDESRNRIYAPALTRKGPSHIWVIDGSTNRLENTIKVDTPMLTGIALDPAHQRLFTSSLKTSEVVVIDTAKGTVTAHWPTGGKSPINLDYDAANQRLFVANQKSGTLTVLDARNGKLIDSVETGKGALDVTHDDKRGRIYVTNRKSGTLSIVDADSYKVLKQLHTGTYPQTVAVNHVTGQVYVSNKARHLPRNAPKDAVPPKDPHGDTVVLISP